MSYDIFVDSSIYNFGSRHRKIIEEELNKVENPQWETTENCDIKILEDFDMRHCEALIKARDRAWKEQE